MELMIEQTKLLHSIGLSKTNDTKFILFPLNKSSPFKHFLILNLYNELGRNLPLCWLGFSSLPFYSMSICGLCRPNQKKKKKKPNVDLSYYKLYWTSHQATICLQGFQTCTIKKSNVVGIHMVEHIIYGTRELGCISAT